MSTPLFPTTTSSSSSSTCSSSSSSSSLQRFVRLLSALSGSLTLKERIPPSQLQRARRLPQTAMPPTAAELDADPNHPHHQQENGVFVDVAPRRFLTLQRWSEGRKRKRKRHEGKEEVEEEEEEKIEEDGFGLISYTNVFFRSEDQAEWIYHIYEGTFFINDSRTMKHPNSAPNAAASPLSTSSASPSSFPSSTSSSSSSSSPATEFFSISVYLDAAFIETERSYQAVHHFPQPIKLDLVLSFDEKNEFQFGAGKLSAWLHPWKLDLHDHASTPLPLTPPSPSPSLFAFPSLLSSAHSSSSSTFGHSPSSPLCFLVDAQEANFALSARAAVSGSHPHVDDWNEMRRRIRYLTEGELKVAATTTRAAAATPSGEKAAATAAAAAAVKFERKVCQFCRDRFWHHVVVRDETEKKEVLRALQEEEEKRKEKEKEEEERETEKEKEEEKRKFAGLIVRKSKL